MKKEDYKTVSLNNRRYLGNKFRLLPFIKEVVLGECGNISSVADIFAGTGIVATALENNRKTRIITNDLMYSNFICNFAWFECESYSLQKIVDFVCRYNSMKVCADNYMSQNFSDTYFSAQDCRKIGFVREDIEKQYANGNLNNRERAILIMSLLYAMDKIAITCGHYDAYRKNASFDNHLELAVPLAPLKNNRRNRCYNEDANKLTKRIRVDLVYIDPPYNSRQYCDAYHLLENVARWEKPEVFGCARKMDRSDLKSRYCTKSASVAFEELITNIKARFILLSYNNMATKGNDRSNARIPDEDILRILERKGGVKIFSKRYKPFSTGKSDIQENEERLFLCSCSHHEDE